MRARFILSLFALAAGPAATFANVATSPNYAITYISIDGGGQRSVAGAYVADVVISGVGGLVPYSGAIGFAGMLNNAPIAMPDIATRTTNGVANVTLAYLLANDVDPDGDALSLFDADRQSAQGGSIGFFPTSLQYTPPPGYNGADTFRYIIADDFGDQAEAIVTVVVAHLPAEQGANTVLMYFLNDGRILVRLDADSGYATYTIQRSDSLTEPNWQDIATTGAGSDGVLLGIDAPMSGTQRYYRAVLR
jgi:hypothetical protein